MSSRATATVTTVERFPCWVRCRWRACRRICACQARGAGLGAVGGAPWWVAVVPGGFGQQPAGVAVAGLGDVPAVLLIAGGVLARGDPEPGRELPRVREAAEVADLGDQPQRGQRRDPAERAELVDLPAPRLALGDLLKLGVQRGELAVDRCRGG